MRKRRTLAAFVIAAFVIAGALAWWFQARDPFYASPTANRDDTEALVQQTWDEFLNASPSSKSPPAVPELPRATVLEYPDGTLVQMQSRMLNDTHYPPAAAAVQADSAGIVNLPGGGKLRLAAFALSVPRADDPSDPENTETEVLTFRRVGDLSELNPEELDELGVPGEARVVSKVARWFPRIRLVLEADDLAFFRLGQWRVFDERTHAFVAQRLKEWPREPGDPIILDAFINIWHDTPLIVALELPSGKPAEKRIELNKGFQTAVAPYLRFQAIAAESGKLTGIEHHDQSWFFNSENTGKDGFLVYRLYPNRWSDHLALRLQRNGEFHDYPVQEAIVAWTHTDFPADEIEEASLVFLPESARAIFRLPAIPEMPNSREEVTNLFDVRIPRLLIPAGAQVAEDPETGEGNIPLSYIYLDVIQGATETTLQPVFPGPAMDVPENYLPKLFTDITPRDLVKEYQLYAEDPYLEVGRRDHMIRFHRPEPLRVRLSNWWHAKGPDWLRW